MSDLENAIEVAEESVAATPRDKPTRARRLHTLSVYLFTRCRLSGAMQDFTRAIQTAQETIDGTRADHADRAYRLTTMSMLLYVRFRWYEAVEDLEKSIEVGEQALQAIPINDPRRADMLGNQGILLAERTVQSTSWAQSARKAKQALELQFPHDLETSKPPALQREHIVGVLPENTAVFSENLHFGTGDTKNSLREMTTIISYPESPVLDFTESINHFLMAWRCDTAQPLHRIFFAKIAASHLRMIGRWAEANSLLEAAVKILPTVSPQFLSRDDQQLVLSESDCSSGRIRHHSLPYFA